MLVERWTIELLGRLCARQGALVVTRFQTQKTAALLAYLAYFQQRSHPREELIELLWPGAEPESGRMSLRTALASLRRQLEPPGTPAGSVLLADRINIRLSPTAAITDIALFQQALRDAHADSPAAEQIERLAQAVELYRGDLLPGFYEDWITPERERQADAYLAALRRLIRLLVQERDFDRALDFAHRALKADPLREDSHRSLMRLYAAVGRPAAAMQQFKEMERILRESLGTTPSETSRALRKELEVAAPQTPATRAVRTATVEEEAAAPAVPPAPPTSPSTVLPRLPLQFTRFFGREEEIGWLEMLLGGSGAGTEGNERPDRHPPLLDTRLVTVTGPGGAGKTRLAIETVGRLREVFGGAVWFVPLADVTEGRQIADAILDMLRLPRDPGQEPLEQVVAFLNREALGDASPETRRGSGSALLVLDNLEQVAEEGADVVRELLARVPTLVCLVTSRQRLELSGEQELALPPLPAPRPKHTHSPEQLLRFPSVQLFVDRAQAVRQDFQVTKGNAPAVGALCERLEGLPLALELAAATAQMLTPAQMLARLERRLDFLVSRRKDIEERHRTLRATIDWSYRLLPADLQRFFAPLSVFRGGWGLEAAEEVCAEPLALDCLTQLRAHSLVVAEEMGETIRFRLLETLREYAAEQLPPEDREALARRHMRCFLRLAREAMPALSGPEQAVWLERLETEHDNLRAALTWCLNDPDSAQAGLELVGALQSFWVTRGHLREARKWAEAMLACDGARTRARADALHTAGLVALNQGDGAARAFFQECLETRRELQDPSGMAHALVNLAFIQMETGHLAEAREQYEEGLALYRTLGHQKGIAAALSDLGLLALYEGDGDRARGLLDESLAMARAQGNRAGIASLLLRLGNAAKLQEEVAQARAFFEESLVLARELNDKPGIAVAQINLGLLARQRQDWAEAHACFAECLSLVWEMGDEFMVHRTLEDLAHLYHEEGQAARAVQLFGAIEDLGKTMVSPQASTYQEHRERALAALRTTLGEAAFAAAYAAGRAMLLEQTVAFVQETT